MSLMLRRDPLETMTRLDEYLDSWFEEQRPARWSPSGWLADQWGNLAPAINLSETDEHYHVVAAIPGLRPDEVEISIAGRELTIRGKTSRQYESQSDTGQLNAQGQASMSFIRVISLPTEVDSNHTTAFLEDGLLRVTLPKAADARPHRVTIHVNGSRPAPVREAAKLLEKVKGFFKR